MTPLSGRLAAPALALLLVAAIPVWVRALADPAPDDCGESLRAASVEALPGTVAARERPDLRGPHHSLWIEGEIAPPARDLAPLRFRIARTSDPASLYGEPLGYFTRNAAPDAHRGTRWLDAGTQRLPVHWRYDDSEGTYVIEYLLVQDGRAIRHPFSAGLANAVRQVADGVRPVTLLLVDGVGSASHREAIQRSAEAWILSAWQRYLEGCRG